MTINHVTPDYAVAGQITEADIATLAAQGFGTIICNRPDSEIETDLHARYIEAEAKRLGLVFVYNPISSQGMTMDNVTTQSQAMEQATSRVFAYCRSGMRSTTCWAFAKARSMPANEIIHAAHQAGYNLEGMRPQLEAMAASA